MVMCTAALHNGCMHAAYAQAGPCARYCSVAAWLHARYCSVCTMVVCTGSDKCCISSVTGPLPVNADAMQQPTNDTLHKPESTHSGSTSSSTSTHSCQQAGPYKVRALEDTPCSCKGNKLSRAAVQVLLEQPLSLYPGPQHKLRAPD